MTKVIQPISNAVETVQQEAAELVRLVKPRLRGWLHLGMVPLTLAAAIVMIVLAPSGKPRIGAIVFGVTALLLFTTSAIYHRGTWGPRAGGLLKRADHSNIFLIIAGTYTPFALMLLPRAQATTLLVIVWSGAIGGVLFRTLWVGAPRWLYTPIYVALGWVAVFYFVPMMHSGGVVVVTLIAAGGLLYTVGALVYGIKRPNPSPRWFGFHEVFHAFTVLAFAAHYTAASLAIYTHPGVA
ncbi:PAQR family membrane homeostasis protein TrhA [Allobranchiibius huperziae]|uniref:PAQR family membrane homeostasis protein TrhA n=1 Tax=Allobranchiibius huperziae TaxID=1874116 RepID=UPI0015CAA8AF